MKRFLRISISIVMLLLFLPADSFSEEKENLLKVGFVRNNGANVRAGDNVNFETLCTLEKGDPVKIAGKRYSWFKIYLPGKAHVYIKGEYVDLAPEQNSIATVNAMRVNLRAGPDTKHSILAQASRPEKLYIVSEKNGWYKIRPPKRAFGWIHSSQIRLIKGINN